MRRASWLSLLLALGTGVALAELPVVEVTKLLDDSSGGSFTLAQTGVIEGRKTFLKSNRGSQRGTRYSNFESDILARAIFEKLGVRCPRARVVRLAPGAPTAKFMGEVVLAMDYVDSRMTHGKVMTGRWPGAKYADLDEYLKMAVVDLVIGNADRRGANFFSFVDYGDIVGDEGKPGSFRPVPIDNNSGFGSMVVWSMPTSQTNFFPTYGGLGSAEVMKDLGTIRNLMLDSEVLHAVLGDAALRPKVLAMAKTVQAKLTDAFFGAAVDALPREIIPRGVAVDPAKLDEWLPRLGLKAADLFGELVKPTSGAALFEYRKVELKRVFAWRRDHLGEALEAYFRETPPTEQE